MVKLFKALGYGKESEAKEKPKKRKAPKKKANEPPKAMEKTEDEKSGTWVLVKKATKKEPSFHDWAKKRVDEDLKDIIDFTSGRA